MITSHTQENQENKMATTESLEGNFFNIKLKAGLVTGTIII